MRDLCTQFLDLVCYVPTPSVTNQKYRLCQFEPPVEHWALCPKFRISYIPGCS